MCLFPIFDLAIAMAVLGAAGEVPADAIDSVLDDAVLLGERLAHPFHRVAVKTSGLLICCGSALSQPAMRATIRLEYGCCLQITRGG